MYINVYKWIYIIQKNLYLFLNYLSRTKSNNNNKKKKINNYIPIYNNQLFTYLI